MPEFYRFKRTGAEIEALLDKVTTYTAGDGILINDQNIISADSSYLATRYQPLLVSGETIKTINGQSLLGTGNITIEGNTGTTITVDAALSTESENPIQNKVVAEAINALTVNVTQKQDALISGTNIKTINSTPILGEGDIVIAASVAADSELSDTSENPVQNKVVSAALKSKLTVSDLTSALAPKVDVAEVGDIIASHDKLKVINRTIDLNTFLDEGSYIITKSGCYNSPTFNSSNAVLLNKKYNIGSTYEKTKQLLISVDGFGCRNSELATNKVISDNNDLTINGVLYSNTTYYLDEAILLPAGNKYVLSGKFTGYINIVAPSDAADPYVPTENTEIELNNAQLFKAKNSGKLISYNFSDKKLIITLAKNSYNYIITNDSTAATETNDEAVIYSENNLVITGCGALDIESNAGCHGLKANDIYISGDPLIKITAKHDAIHGSHLVQIENGTLYLSAGVDGIESKNDSDAEGHVNIFGGKIYILDAAETGIAAKTSGIIYGKDTLISYGSGTPNHASNTIKYLIETTQIDGYDETSDASHITTPLAYFGEAYVLNNVVENEDGTYDTSAAITVTPVNNVYTIEKPNNGTGICMVRGYIDGSIQINTKKYDIVLNNTYINCAIDAPAIKYSAIEKSLSVKSLDKTINIVTQTYTGTSTASTHEAIMSNSSIKIGGDGNVLLTSAIDNGCYCKAKLTLKSDGMLSVKNSGKAGIVCSTAFFGDEDDAVAATDAGNATGNVYCVYNNTLNGSYYDFMDVSNGSTYFGVYYLYPFFKAIALFGTFYSEGGKGTDANIALNYPTYASYVAEYAFTKKIKDDISTEISIYKDTIKTILDAYQHASFTDWSILDMNTEKLNTVLSNYVVTSSLANALSEYLGSQKGAVNGVASLDSSGLIPSEQLPGGATLSAVANPSTLACSVNTFYNITALANALTITLTDYSATNTFVQEYSLRITTTADSLAITLPSGFICFYDTNDTNISASSNVLTLATSGKVYELVLSLGICYVISHA